MLYIHKQFLEEIQRHNLTKIKNILKNPNYNPSIRNNEAFIWAIEIGYQDTVELLLNDKRIDPSDQENKAFITASSYGSQNIMTLLTNDKRVNIHDQNNRAFFESIIFGLEEITKYYFNIFTFIKETYTEIDNACEFDQEFDLLFKYPQLRKDILVFLKDTDEEKYIKFNSIYKISQLENF